MGKESRGRLELGVGPRMHPMRPGEKIQVDLKNSTPKLCQKCGGRYFQQVFVLLSVSALVSPIGKEMVASQPVFICLECKTLLEGNVGKEAKEEAAK